MMQFLVLVRKQNLLLGSLAHLATQSFLSVALTTPVVLARMGSTLLSGLYGLHILGVVVIFAAVEVVPVVVDLAVVVVLDVVVAVVVEVVVVVVVVDMVVVNVLVVVTALVVVEGALETAVIVAL